LVAILFILACAAFFSGITIRTRSIFSGRKGPRILQPLYDIRLLLRKGSVFSAAGSVVTQAAPTVALAATLTAALMIPLGKYYPALFSFDADFVMFAYLLALGRFAYLANALDSGGAFQGMGASREALFGLLVEPAFFIIMGSLALLTGNSSFADIMYNFHNDGINGIIMGLLAAFVLFNLLLIETGRVPVDDPRTHLELTMVHEAMLLDNSGFDLALLKMNTLLKFSIFGTLIATCVIPQGMGAGRYVLLYLAVQLLCAVVVGWIESFRPRYSMLKNPSYMLAISSISFIAFLAAVALEVI
jgi:formate hydrogenlyase subunit 4